jgi:hypothetical protein
MEDSTPQNKTKVGVLSHQPAYVINTKASSLTKVFPEGVAFNTDTFPITIDSGSTYCLSDRRSDFEGVLTRVNVKVQGVTDSKGASKCKDTVRWKVQGDHGKRQAFNIPKTLALLPIQHTRSGTQAIGDEEVKLQWGNCRFSKTIKISRKTYIPMMPSAPGFKRFKAFIANIDQCDSNTTPHHP